MTTTNHYILSEATSASATVLDVETLCEMREEFEARTNRELYNLLAGIYAVYLNAEARDFTAEAVETMKIKLKDKYKIKTQKNTRPLTVFVRFVYRTDRKKAYTYSKVLEFALENKVTADSLPAFIEEKGGIEKCKEANKSADNEINSGIEAKQTVEQRKAALSAMDSFATVEIDSSLFDPDKATDFVFVAGRINDDGQLELLKIVQDVNAAMLEKATKAAKRAEVSVKQQVNDSSSLSDALLSVSTIIDVVVVTLFEGQANVPVAC